ncbi:MAG: tyrosine-type recombinase/integrase [Acidimicrobiales bacterium]
MVQLIEAAEKDTTDFACFLLLAAATGARRGELCGLRWSDVDLKAMVLTISRSVVEAEKDTKTHVSRRPRRGNVEGAQDPQGALRRAGVGLRRHVARVGARFLSDADGKRPWAPNDVTKDFIRLRNRSGSTRFTSTICAAAVSWQRGFRYGPSAAGWAAPMLRPRSGSTHASSTSPTAKLGSLLSSSKRTASTR